MFCLGSTSIVFLIYNNIGDLLKPVDDPGVVDYSRYAAAGEITVNSPVIAAAISNPETFALNNVTFTLKHTQVQFDWFINYFEIECNFNLMY